MFREIGDIKNIPAFLEKCKTDKNTRLWGFGHRVFKAMDFRAIIIKEMIKEFISSIGAEDQYANLLHVALELEKQALADEYF